MYSLGPKAHADRLASIIRSGLIFVVRTDKNAASLDGYYTTGYEFTTSGFHFNANSRLENGLFHIVIIVVTNSIAKNTLNNTRLEY